VARLSGVAAIRGPIDIYAADPIWNVGASLPGRRSQPPIAEAGNTREDAAGTRAEGRAGIVAAGQRNGVLCI
jgi:hypothetical protein